jgi:hypothetical protein
MGLMLDNLRDRLPRLRSPRGLGFVAGAAVAALLLGELSGFETAGRVLALACIPLLARPDTAEPPHWRPGLDALQAVAAGLLVAALCHLFLAGPLLAEGQTTGSDMAEWFWSLHSLSNPGWEHFSANRYPQGPLLVRLLTFADSPHGAWYAGALGSMVVTAAGLWIWGRAVAGAAAGWAAALMVAALPDLVVMCRSVTGYPEIIAAWTLGAGLVAYAMRHPRAWTCLLAGVGCAGAFGADARGLIPGMVITAVAVMAALSARGWRRRLLCLGLVALPLYGSWIVHNQLPLKPRPLEGLLATSIQVSYQRTGDVSPWDLGVSEGWIWGRSMAWEIPDTVRALREARGRLNPKIATLPEQRNAVERNVLPFAGGLAVLGLLALGSCLREPEDLEGWRRWASRIDLRATIALLPLSAHAAWFLNVVQYEYYTRYFALAMPGVALLLGAGLTITARRRPLWLALLPVLLTLWVVPSGLNTRASWRGRGAAQKQLQICLAAARGEIERPSFQDRQQDQGVYECYSAQSTPLDRPVAWPW